jgi:hypothetical protein
MYSQTGPLVPKSDSASRRRCANEGFTDWGKIGLDDEDDVWAIDDAHAFDGQSYDLLLHPDTLAIIAREPHDEARVGALVFVSATRHSAPNPTCSA